MSDFRWKDGPIKMQRKGPAHTVYGDYEKITPAAALLFVGCCLMVLYIEIVGGILICRHPQHMKEGGIPCRMS